MRFAVLFVDRLRGVCSIIVLLSLNFLVYFVLWFLSKKYVFHIRTTCKVLADFSCHILGILVYIYFYAPDRLTCRSNNNNNTHNISNTRQEPYLTVCKCLGSKVYYVCMQFICFKSNFHFLCHRYSFKISALC